MRHAKLWVLLVPLGGLLGCGGGAEPSGTTAEPAPVATSGGEDPADTERVMLRNTVPVPVPQTPTAREDLSEPLQNLWTRTEEVVAERAPEPPQDSTNETIRTWAESELSPWMDARRAAIEQAEPMVEQIEGLERAVAAALFGYMYEDTAAGVRGSPVPIAIAHDLELLEVYDHSLKEMVRPFAIRALESYVYCASTISQTEAEGLSEAEVAAWSEWSAYCFQRALDVAGVFDLEGPAADGSAP